MDGLKRLITDACTWEMIRRVLLPSWVGALAEENGRLPCGLVAAVREDVKTMSPCPWRGECTVKSGGRPGQELRNTLGNCCLDIAIDSSYEQ